MFKNKGANPNTPMRIYTEIKDKSNSRSRNKSTQVIKSPGGITVLTYDQLGNKREIFLRGHVVQKNEKQKENIILPYSSKLNEKRSFSEETIFKNTKRKNYFPFSNISSILNQFYNSPKNLKVFPMKSDITQKSTQGTENIYLKESKYKSFRSNSLNSIQNMSPLNKVRKLLETSINSKNNFNKNKDKYLRIFSSDNILTEEDKNNKKSLSPFDISKKENQHKIFLNRSPFNSNYISFRKKICQTEKMPILQTYSNDKKSKYVLTEENRTKIQKLSLENNLRNIIPVKLPEKEIKSSLINNNLNNKNKNVSIEDTSTATQIKTNPSDKEINIISLNKRNIKDKKRLNFSSLFSEFTEDNKLSENISPKVNKKKSETKI
ncbi:MAG: hypothetical protein MJ252_18820, partial [archaeon]|nr:hypothetical protein [archaeon]